MASAGCRLPVRSGTFVSPSITAPSAEASEIDAVSQVISALQASDPSFSMAGASWTNNLSWVRGYESVLEPMQQLSAAFHARFDPLVAADPAVTRSPAYQGALLHLLLLEPSCFRYWGQGTWTDYAGEMYRRGMNLCCNGPTDGG